MTRSRRLPLCLLAWVLVNTVVSSSYAELTADQVAIIANRHSPDSLALARYYASRRGIPTDRILQLDVSTQETISRKDYDEHVVRPLREALQTKHLTQKVRVLVTTYGIPLRVDAPQPNDAERQWLNDATDRQRFARSYLAQTPEWARRIARSSADAPSAPTGTKAEETDATLLDQINKAIHDAIARINQAETREPRATIEAWNKELARVIVQTGGTAALFRSIKTEPAATQPSQATLREQTLAAQTVIGVLADTPSDITRKQAYQLAERVFGLEGVLRLATAELEHLSYKNGDAALDSELTLLWWNRNQYRIASRFANPLFHANLASGNAPASLPVMLVSRLDAPSLQLAQAMIERALTTEQQGLTGKAYVDSRGIQPDGTIGYGYYDQGLRDLADLLRAHSAYPVILEDTERRFSQRGEAPDVAVYAGWYKLRSYEDAFTFNPGAIGYHIASGEAVSVHDPAEAGWCKNALERGITVTLGPTGEPYVDAFPLPNEFFALLLTGRYSLAEAYAFTTRYISWRMVLFGDPLYNPWRGRGSLADSQTVLRNVTSKTSLRGAAPFVFPFNDPIKARQENQLRREQALAEARRFVEEFERQTQKRK